MYDPLMRLAMVNPAQNNPSEFPAGNPEDRLTLEAVQNELAIRNSKAPKLTQDEVKRKIASTEKSNFEMGANVPTNIIDKMQREEDKTHQQVIKEYMKKREKLAKNAEDRARILGNNFQGQVDLSPLMALSDTWFGGNLARSYQAPETQAQNLAAQQQYENQSRSEYGKLTDDEMNLLRQNLMGEQYQANRKLQKDKLDLSKKALALKGSKPKAMGAETIKRLDSVNMAMQGLQNARAAVAKGVKVLPSTITNISGDNEYSVAARMFKDGLGRLQSGGAINKDEEASFLAMLPKWNDSNAVKKTKFAEMEKLLNQRLGNIRGDITYGAPQAKTATSTYNPEDPEFIKWKQSRGI